ncbi:MAG: MarR family transcriptional regulator [Lachnospiraceae bacterium]|nr:MarR family transcriptional regulator [Lachnospiraceae bacterium]
MTTDERVADCMDHMDAKDRYDCLKLENQLCFPLYACSKEIVRLYTPALRDLGLTYTQYIAMMVLWEKGSLSVSELGKCLYLDSGTLTPLLKKLEGKGFRTRQRSENDERSVIVSVTDSGMALREMALEVRDKVGTCLGIDSGDADTLYSLCYRILSRIQ